MPHPKIVIVMMIKVNPEASMTKIKAMRVKLGLRQLDLAKKADVSLTWLWALENSFSSRVSKDIKDRVARALGCAYEDLFPGQ